LNEANQANGARMAWQRVMDGSRAAALDVIAHHPRWRSHVAKGQSLVERLFAELRKESDVKQNIGMRYSRRMLGGKSSSVLIKFLIVC
jgi:hypothetical protein